MALEQVLGVAVSELLDHASALRLAVITPRAMFSIAPALGIDRP
jgi:hypothetical protein